MKTTGAEIHAKIKVTIALFVVNHSISPNQGDAGFSVVNTWIGVMKCVLPTVEKSYFKAMLSSKLTENTVPLINSTPLYSVHGNLFECSIKLISHIPTGIT